MTTEPGAGEFYPFVGVGPHPKPWPVGNHYDPELLENGDKRNVLDEYRYWTVAAIVADLDKKRNHSTSQSRIGNMISTSDL